MSNATTPREITTKIIELCKSITLLTEPEYIKVSPQLGSTYNNCFDNVDKVVLQNGGHRVLGWSIWQWSNVLVEAEAHAVWRNSSRILLDITPHIGNEKRILFLPDPSLIYEGNRFPNRRLALTSSPLVAELIKICDEVDYIASITPGNFYEIPSNIYYRKRIIIETINRKVGRNEPCPCQSGLKYKRCCGKWR